MDGMRRKLAVMLCGGVRAGYRVLKGIVMNADTYYQIPGFKLKGSDTLRLSFTPRATCNVAGCYTSASAQNNYSVYVSADNNAKYMRYAGGAYYSGVALNLRHDVVVTPTGSFGFARNGTWEEKTFVGSSDFCIGTTSPSVTSLKFEGIMHGAVIVDQRARFVPCERLSDHAIGYYETKTGVFFAPEMGSPTEET